MQKVLYFLPRGITALAVFFFFVSPIVDAWQNGFNLNGFLLMEALAVVFLGITVFSWENPKIGGIIFIILAVAQGIAISRSIVPPPLPGIILPTLPALITGVLFLREGLKKEK